MLLKKIKTDILLRLERKAYKKSVQPYLKSHSLNIMSARRTLKYIIKNKVSVSRFGDGEFGIIFNNKDIGFQKYSIDLQTRLRETFINGNSKNLLICIPYSLNNLFYLII